MTVKRDQQCKTCNESLAAYFLYNPFTIYQRTYPAIEQTSGLVTRPNSEKHEMTVREFQAAPAYANGVFIPEAESYLLNGSDSRYNKVCDRYAECDYNRFTPFNTCLQIYMAHEHNVIQSVNEKVGVSTRPAGSSLLDKRSNSSCKPRSYFPHRDPIFHTEME